MSDNDLVLIVVLAPAEIGKVLDRLRGAVRIGRVLDLQAVQEASQGMLENMGAGMPSRSPI